MAATTKKKIWRLWVITILVTAATVIFGSERTEGLRQGNLSPLVPLTQSPTLPIARNNTTTPEASPEGSDPTKDPTPTENMPQSPAPGESEPSGKPEDTPAPLPSSSPTPSATPMPTPTEVPKEEPTESPSATPAITTAAALDTAPTAAPPMTGNRFIGAGGRVIYTDKPMVALTFDDGPLVGQTEALLDLFEAYNSRATFFTVGYKIDNYPDTIKNAYSRGFQIANHTLNHVFLNKVPIETAYTEVHDNEEKLRKLGIKGTILLRPPYGEYNKEVAAMAGAPMIGWSVDSRDWETYDQYKTRNQIINDVRDGYIVLCHDIHVSTIEAMQYVVPELIEMGYQLVTVDELFYAKGITPENGVYYRMAK